MENLYIPNDKNVHPMPINSSNNVRGGQYNRSISHQYNPAPQDEVSMSQNHNTQLRRSTSMSCPSQAGSLPSTKNVTFTLPITEGNQVGLMFW